MKMSSLSNIGNLPLAYPNGKTICPNCGGRLIAKCGQINIWHWAHECVDDCDSWNYEPKTEWHTQWQNHFGSEFSEIYLRKDGESHRADIITHKGLVIEVQNSPISLEEIISRESFYENMIWVINSKDFKHNLRFKNYPFDTSSEIWLRWVHKNPSQSEFAFSVIVPDDDFFENVINALKECNFDLTYDEKKQVECWACLKSSYYDLPKKIYDAFTSYLIDSKFLQLFDCRKIYNTNFFWSYFRKVWLHSRSPKFIDLNNGYLFYIVT